jgi:nicotinamidase-related amidase
MGPEKCAIEYHNRAAASLLTPSNCLLMLIDYQQEGLLAVESIDHRTLLENVLGLGRAALVFGIPILLTTMDAKFAGPLLHRLEELFPEKEVLERTTMNPWEDAQVYAAIQRSNCKKIVLAGIWTENCVTLPALSALQCGYDVYVIADACGGLSGTGHDMAILEMIQAGVVPLSWMGFMLEMQRDWALKETAERVVEIALEHRGELGQFFPEFHR